MEFTEIDIVPGYAVETGDIVWIEEDQEFYLLRGVPEDEGSVITFTAEGQTSTESDDHVIIDPDADYSLYQAS